MLRCSICLDEDEAFGVLPCGHVFGISCLNQHFNIRRDCPKCRATADPEDVRNIFLDSYGPIKNEPKDLSVHLPAIEGIMRRAREINIDSNEGELTGIIQAAEHVTVHFDEYQSCFNDVLEQLHEVLGALRKRLKYAAHLRSAQAEVARALTAVGSRDEQIDHNVQENAKLRREVDAGVKDSIRLARRNQQWLDKYNRLKSKYRTLEHRHGALHKEHKQKLTEARNSLSEKDGRMLRYKKKLLAQREELELARKIAHSCEAWSGVLEGTDEAELDISGMPGGFPSSQPNLGEPCSKRPSYEFGDEPGSQTDTSSC